MSALSHSSPSHFPSLLFPFPLTSLPSYYLLLSLFLRKGKGGLIPSPLGEG